MDSYDMNLFDFQQMLSASGERSDEENPQVQIVDQSGTIYTITDVKWDPVEKAVQIHTEF